MFRRHIFFTDIQVLVERDDDEVKISEDQVSSFRQFKNQKKKKLNKISQMFFFYWFFFIFSDNTKKRTTIFDDLQHPWFFCGYIISTFYFWSQIDSAVNHMKYFGINHQSNLDEPGWIVWCAYVFGDLWREKSRRKKL